MQIKTTKRYHLTPIRITVIKKSENTGKDKERRAPLYTVGGNVNWYSLYWKRYADSLKDENWTEYDPAISHLYVYLMEIKSLYQREINVPMFIVAFFFFL